MTPTPTQVRRPWRATARTTFQALVAFAVLFPILVETAGLDPEAFPWLAIPLAVAAALARVMALPQVETFLRRFLPFLAAAPSDARPDNERGSVTLVEVLVVAVLAATLILVVSAFPVGRG